MRVGKSKIRRPWSLAVSRPEARREANRNYLNIFTKLEETPYWEWKSEPQRDPDQTVDFGLTSVNLLVSKYQGMQFADIDKHKTTRLAKHAVRTITTKAC